MPTDEQFEEQEQKELDLTEKILAFMTLAISNLRNSLESEIYKFYRKYGTDGVVSYTDARKIVSSEDRRKRVNVLMLTISRSFSDVQSSLESQFSELQHSLLTAELDFFNIDSDDFDFTFKPWGADNDTWEGRLDANVRLWTYNIQKDIKQGFIKQQNVETVIEQLQKRTTSIEKAVKRLVVTESTAMTSLVRQAIFKDIGASSYRYYTQKDERVCEQCGPLHGKVFPISAYEVGVTAPPVHPRCRCWTIPIES